MLPGIPDKSGLVAASCLTAFGGDVIYAGSKFSYVADGSRWHRDVFAAARPSQGFKPTKQVESVVPTGPGGGSITSRDNLMRLLLQKATGAQWNFIYFPSGGERLSNLLGGHVQMMVIEPQEAGEQIRAGNLRVIASLTEKRLPTLPNVPTIKEQGIDVPIIPQARGLLAPPAVPKEVVAYWEGVFDAFVKTPSWKQYLEQNQFEDAYLKGPALNKFIDALKDQMREVLKEARAKVVR